MSETVSFETDAVNLACFEVCGQEYALPVENVREIVRIMEVTPLPNAPALIEGVIDLRGAVVPVIDLAKMLGRGVGDSAMSARIVVLDVAELTFGLWVSGATDVLTLGRADLEAVPALATQSGYAVVRHVVRRPERAPVMVLSIENLIAAVQRSETGSAVEKEGPA
ncbi:MAG: chemotaxis protein CheW [Myxococcota bacterium]